ncbi:MAG TPA: carboxylating nicotinate-nucleotide diphosphorylase [Acidimicrobiales bacterium]|nr:carboxylating nicotinate-nucleotide diphosphorylase [Acidimicrobiales bacterium]
MAAVREAVARALAEDLGPDGDVSSALIEDREARAVIVSRQSGVLAGSLCAEEAFRQVDASTRVDWLVRDSDDLHPDQKVATMGGRLSSLLTAERTALNFLGHLSGVAGFTRKFVDAVTTLGQAQILDTRKTTPGLRELEKAAVRAGGGTNHRMSLSDMVLLKDNHLMALGITEAVAQARRRWPALKVEVECETLEQVIEAVDAGVDVVMLDNMSPDEVAHCVGKMDGRCPVEVSGNVTLETAGVYSAAGADWISVGRLTHSAPALDLSMEIRVAPDSEGFF